MLIKFKITLTALTFLCACTWVNENSAGRSVVMTHIDNTEGCTKVGNISAEVKAKIGFIHRSNEKVIDELRVLARNEAIKLRANTIAADGKPINGKQTYQAFTCP